MNCKCRRTEIQKSHILQILNCSSSHVFKKPVSLWPKNFLSRIVSFTTKTPYLISKLCTFFFKTGTLTLCNHARMHVDVRPNNAFKEPIDCHSNRYVHESQSIGPPAPLESCECMSREIKITLNCRNSWHMPHCRHRISVTRHSTTNVTE